MLFESSPAIKFLLIIVFYLVTYLLFVYQVVKCNKVEIVLRIQKTMVSLSFLLCTLISISFIAFVYKLGVSWFLIAIIGSYLGATTVAEMMMVYKILCKPSQKDSHLIKSASK